MTTFLCNDLVINEDFCNLSCEYCLTGQSNLKERHREKLIFQPPHRDHYKAGTPLRDRLDAIVARFAERFGAPILKITGGEVFLVAGIEDFIDRCAARFDTVIVQTNGVLVRDAQMQRMAAHDNLVLQISLDSPHYRGNAYRVANESQHRKVLDRIERLLDTGLPAEFYAVVNDRSVEDLSHFAHWLSQFPGPPQLFPFPVRGPDSERFAMQSDQIDRLIDLAQNREAFGDVLPPRAYLDRLIRFYRDGERRFRCHLPRLAASTFSDGTITPCPNIWFSDAGDMTQPDWRQTATRMLESGVRQALLAETPRLDACKKCFTPWDVLSMYMDGELTLDEVCATPAYRSPGIRRLLADAKQAISPNPAETDASAV